MKARPLFVDASAWVALFDVRDRKHEVASAFWRRSLEERFTFLTNDYVLDESFTLLRRCRNGLASAVALHDFLAASRLVEIAEVDPGLCGEAWEIFIRYEDKVLSFTDCVSFALMRERRLLEVFSFDGDFRRAGFVVRPEPL